MVTRIRRIAIRYYPMPDAPAVTYIAMAKEKKPMPMKQRNAINALIRKLCANYDRAGNGAVSYTHLTLPTSDLV